MVAERVEEFLAHLRRARRGEGEVPVAPRVQARDVRVVVEFVVVVRHRARDEGFSKRIGGNRVLRGSFELLERRLPVLAAKTSHLLLQTLLVGLVREIVRVVGGVVVGVALAHVVVVALDVDVLAAAAAVVEEIGDGDETLTVSRVHLKRAGRDERRGGEKRAVPRGAVLRLLSLRLGLGVGVGFGFGFVVVVLVLDLVARRFFVVSFRGGYLGGYLRFRGDAVREEGAERRRVFAAHVHDSSVVFAHQRGVCDESSEDLRALEPLGGAFVRPQVGERFGVGG